MDVDAAPAKPTQQRLSIQLSSDELKALEKHYSVDVIVRAIGARQNPTLHNSALLLLAQIARVFPQKVLSNIMAVFSFMGASTQRSDDNYTFIVIQKTVERVIPALLSAEQKLDGSKVSTSALINVFIDRFDTIPTHRRLLLFTLILKILRGRSYLPYVVVNLFRRHQEHQFLERQKADDGLATSPVAEAANEDEGTSIPSFCQSLLQKFSPHEAVSCLGSLVALMNDSRDQLENSSLALVNLAKMNKVQLLIDGIDFIASYVVSKPFINQLVALSTAEEEKIQHYLLQLFRNLLVLYARATDQQKVSANSKSSQGEQRNWLDISERVYEALERVNDLLTISSFVQVIGSLLQHHDASIQQKALLLFNDKLTQQSGLIADSHVSLFLQLTQKLFSSVTSEAAESKAHLSAVNRQTAALTVEIVARQFGSNTKYTETFLGLAKQVTQHLSAYTTERRSDSESAKVQSSMLVAIATLCSSLDQQLLPLLNDFFPAILHTLKSATTSMSGGSVDDNQRLLQLSALSSLQVIIRTLGRFLSTYMSDLLTSLLQPALLQFGEQMVHKVRAVLELIAEHVRLRALLAPLSSAFTTLKASDAAKSMSLLIDFAGSVSKHMTRSDIQTQHKQLFGFYRQAFDYRAAVSPTGSSSKKNTSALDSILAVEDRIIASFSQFVLRLNEAMFKPLFIAIIDWAQINNSAVMQSDAGYNPQRSLFFYRLLVALSDQLKSIFVPYYTYVVDHVVAILRNPSNDQTAAGHVDSHLLLSSVIAALYKCFLYDSEGWLDKEKFNKLMPAIVDQLDTVRVGTVEQYRERVSRHLVPCVAQLAVAVNHDSLWKPLNYQVLLKTRSSNPVVRFAALSIVDELYHRLGEEFLVLLPESIQFFSELLEDSSEDVEELMLKFVKRVEDLLGEENGLMNLLK
jgi:U3 small nucleolar RNA-associated protein 10